LQDENDTQITNYSPIKKMEHLLSLVERKYPDKTILYKKHPQYKLNIKTRSNFIEVNEDVHHYIPYADKVIGINSNVLFETLLYHSNVESYGYGMCSRKLNNDNDRKKFITHCYNRQLLFEDLNNTLCIKDSYFYKKMTNVN
jgi:capsule polysaccharide export protein KpsC/LpsZ